MSTTDTKTVSSLIRGRSLGPGSLGPSSLGPGSFGLMLVALGALAACGSKEAPAEPAAEPGATAEAPAAPAEVVPATPPGPKLPELIDHATQYKSNPRVWIMEFSEFQCPFCSKVQPTLKKLKEDYGPDLQISFLHNPLPFHRHARGAARASIAAGRQGQFWDMHDRLFGNQDELALSALKSHARAAGLDMAQFARDMADAEVDKLIDHHVGAAHALGANGAPAFFVNGKVLKGAQPLERFKTLIDSEIAAAEAAGESGHDWLHARFKKNNPELYGYLFEGRVPPKPKTPKAKDPVRETVHKVTVSDADAAKGAKEPLVTLVTFEDFQCPYCKQNQATLDKLLEKHPDDVRVVFKHNPMSFHPQAGHAAAAAICAQAQGKFWEIAARFHGNQQMVGPNHLDKHVQDLELDAKQMADCIADPATAKRIEDDRLLAQQVQARGTPNVYFNGRKLNGAKPLKEFERVLGQELEKAKAKVAGGVPRKALYGEIIKHGKVFKPLGDEVVTIKTEGGASQGATTPVIDAVAFLDFQCPFSKRALGPLKELVETYEGRFRFTLMHHPMQFHKQARAAHRAAICAEAQGKFWEMADLLFARQRELADDRFALWAKELELDADAFSVCVASDATKKRIDDHIAEGRKAGVRGTPAIYMNGRRFTSPGGYQTPAFVSVIERDILGPMKPKVP